MIGQSLKDGTYPLRGFFDEDDEDIDEGGEWQLRRRPMKSRSLGGKTVAAKRRGQRQKARQRDRQCTAKKRTATTAKMDHGTDRSRANDAGFANAEQRFTGNATEPQI